MKCLSKYLLILSLACMGYVSIAQADAGADKETCQGKAVQIGNHSDPELCYSWIPNEGLDNPYSPNPSASPNKTTTYTVFVTGKDFSSKTQDEVKVTVYDIQDIVFDRPYFFADMEMTTIPNIVSDLGDRKIKWSIEGDPLDAKFEFDRIKAGARPGDITIRATDEVMPECYYEKPLKILDPVKEVTVEDVKNRGRIAKEGQTLWLVGSNQAEVKASPVQKFTGLAPIWKDDGITQYGKATFVASLNAPETKTYTATEDHTVFVKIVRQEEKELKPLPYLSGECMGDFEKSFRFKGVEASLKGELVIGEGSWKEKLVPKYKNIELGWTSELTLAIKGSLAGSISHPAFSGDLVIPFTNSSVEWELGLQAAIEVNLKGTIKVDPSDEYQGLQGDDLTLEIEGSAEIGFEVSSDSPFHQINAGIKAKAKTGGEFRLHGKEIQGKFSGAKVQGEIGFSLQYDMNDPEAVITYSENAVLIDGFETEWKRIIGLD